MNIFPHTLDATIFLSNQTIWLIAATLGILLVYQKNLVGHKSDVMFVVSFANF